MKKVELAPLVTEDQPDQNAINQKIDEILELKRGKMRKKYAFKVEVRRILTPDQRIFFDKKLFKKALHDKLHADKKRY